MTRLAIAFAWGCAAAAALYAAVRIVQSLVFREADPALVVMSLHAGYFWRSWTVAYVGGMVAFVAWIAAGRDALATAKALERALYPIAALVFLQSIFVP